MICNEYAKETLQYSATTISWCAISFENKIECGLALLQHFEMSSFSFLHFMMEIVLHHKFKNETSYLFDYILFFVGIVPDMDTAPGLAPPIPPARGLDLEYEIEGKIRIFGLFSSLSLWCHVF